MAILGGYESSSSSSASEGSGQELSQESDNAKVEAAGAVEEASDSADSDAPSTLPSVAAAFAAGAKAGAPHKEAAEARIEQALTVVRAAAMRRKDRRRNREEKKSGDEEESSDFDGGPQPAPSVGEAAEAYEDFLAEADLAQMGRQDRGEVSAGIDIFASMQSFRRRELQDAVSRFAAQANESEGASAYQTFPASLSSFERKFVHCQAESYGLSHASHGMGSNRAIRISFRQVPDTGAVLPTRFGKKRQRTK